MLTFLVYMVCASLVGIALYQVFARLAAFAAMVAWVTQWCSDIGASLAGFTLFAWCLSWIGTFWQCIVPFAPFVSLIFQSAPAEAAAASSVAMVPVTAFDAKMFAAILTGIGSLLGYAKTK